MPDKPKSMADQIELAAARHGLRNAVVPPAPDAEIEAAALIERLQATALLDQAAIELAYGLLWLAPTDRSTRCGALAYQARQVLLPRLDRDGKLRGVKAAQDMLPAPGTAPPPAAALDPAGEMVLHPLSDIRDLDAVVAELGIQDSTTTPAEAVRELNAEIERLRAELEARQRRGNVIDPNTTDCTIAPLAARPE